MKACLPALCMGLALAPATAAARTSPGAPASDARQAPEISAGTWINTDPLTLAGLRGRVVLVEFWTFGCVNCRHVEPHVKAWHRSLGGRGLTVIGVHSPEFAYEADVDQVRRYVAARGIAYPVEIDNDFATWDRYGNRYWPALYVIDRAGRIRLVSIGEGRYEEIENLLEKLLAEPTPP